MIEHVSVICKAVQLTGHLRLSTGAAPATRASIPGGCRLEHSWMAFHNSPPTNTPLRVGPSSVADLWSVLSQLLQPRPDSPLPPTLAIAMRLQCPDYFLFVLPPLSVTELLRWLAFGSGSDITSTVKPQQNGESVSSLISLGMAFILCRCELCAKEENLKQLFTPH